MAWKIHTCYDISQSRYSVIKTESMMNTSNGIISSPLWVVKDDLDDKFVLVDITNCPYCGDGLD